MDFGVSLKPEGSADKLLKRRRGRKSALGVIKSAAVWLWRLQFKCVMCWVNDTVARSTLPPPALEPTWVLSVTRLYASPVLRRRMNGFKKKFE